MKNELITSRKNPEVMYAASLLTKKAREQEKVFIAEGLKLFSEAVDSGAELARIYIREDKQREYIPVIREKLGDEICTDGRLFILSASAFEKISSENAPQGIISVIKSLDIFKKCITIYKKDFLSFNRERILALCSVRDPGNLGAIIRSAVAFGFDRLLLSDDCAELTNPKTVRAAMGALFKLQTVTVSDFSSVFSAAREAGRRIFCAELTEGAVSITETELCASDVIVIGNEGHGIPADYSRLASGSVYIPIAPNTESLNAAVAASILLWELGRKE